MKQSKYTVVSGIILNLAATISDAASYQIQNIGLADSRTYIDYAGMLTSTGKVLGHSEGYDSQGATHSSFWLFTPASGTQIVQGLSDASHTPPPTLTNYDSYIAAVMDDAGQITGNTPRFINGYYAGYDSWFYSPLTGQTQLIGIIDAGHTSADGFSGNFPEQINSAGQVEGSVSRDDPQGNTNDVWLYSPQTNTTQVIGVFDAAHTGSDGSRSSYAKALSDTGLVVGSVSRYNGTVLVAQDAWVYQSSTHIAQLINLSSDFNSTTNRVAVLVNNAGQIAGTADGQAWFADSPNSIGHLIGPTDSIHMSVDGTVDNTPLLIDPAGQVMGEAGQFHGQQERGQDVWYYTPGTDRTQIIGLTDAAHTIGYGWSFNESSFLNNAGQVVGDAETSDIHGIDGWLFDPGTDTTYQIALPTGYTLEGIDGLNNNGEVIGSMYGFGIATSFIWTESGGAQPIDSLLTGGLSANGWSSLDQAMQVNDDGQIAGYGKIVSGQLSAFLLTPTSVPEPASLSIIALVLPAMLSKRIREYPSRQR